MQEEFITIRGGRLVIPIKIEHRNRYTGIVHDRSRSGDSLFFEPVEAVELNNTLAELQAKSKLEEARIIARLSVLLFDNWSDICRVLRTLAELDLLSAKARLAELYGGMEPSFSSNGKLLISDARHPLLDERLKALKSEAGIEISEDDEQPVVPITIRIGGDWSVLVITGPNAGGKTVALKTAGLLTLMAQTGLQVPARDYHGPVFNTVSADIGDYQNILSHLSTFSSHLTMLRQLFQRMKAPALVLLDEIAAATDPGEGSALAMAVLEQLRENGAYVMTTTHLEAIKAFAQASEGMENACVEFDPKTMRPTFQLRYGTPGISNALKTAEDIGLPGTVIERARGYLGKDGARASEIIVKLQEELTAVSQERKKLEEEREALEAARKHYVRRLDAAGDRERKELQQIKAEWQNFKREQAREMKSAIEELRKAKSLQEARTVARKKENELESEFENLRLSKLSVNPPQADDGGPLSEGDVVEITDFGRSGTIIRNWQQGSGQDVMLEIDGKRLTLPRTAIARKGSRKPDRKSTKIRILAEERTPALELNVVGLNVDEALQKTERFLDEALLKGLPWVQIIHGRGTGTLRKAIAEHLKEQPFVARWHHADPAAGGNAVTVVKFSR